MPSVFLYLGILLITICVWFMLLKRPVYEAVLISFLLLLTLVLSLLAACGGNSADDGKIKIAIVQQLDHASLNEIRTAIEAEMDKIADWITLAVNDFDAKKSQISEEVQTLCAKFPIY